MDEAEVNRLCEELNALIQSTQSGDYVDNKLIALTFGFEQWFSSDKCTRQHARGQIVRDCLERDLISLQAAMWRKSNDETKKRRIVEFI